MSNGINIPFLQRKKISPLQKFQLVLEIFYDCETNIDFLSKVDPSARIENKKIKKSNYRETGLDQTTLGKILRKKLGTRELNRQDYKRILGFLSNLGLIREKRPPAMGGRQVFYWITEKGVKEFPKYKEKFLGNEEIEKAVRPKESSAQP